MEEDKLAINTIPISLTKQSDKLVWRCMENGIFSVKSAYHLAKHMECSRQSKGSRPVEDCEIWKKLWKLPIQNVEKIFMWRACQNILPTKDNLLQRKIVIDPLCPICKRDAETIFHALWACPTAEDIWGASKSKFQKCSFIGSDFTQVAETILQKKGTAKLASFIWLARKIWL
jgi:hypothetical protein